MRLNTPFIKNVNDALAGAYYRGGSSTVATGIAEGAVEEDHLRRISNNSNSLPESKFTRNADLDDRFLVMIRHGRTEYNKLGIFTGWEDAPLAREGVVLRQGLQGSSSSCTALSSILCIHLG